MPLFLSVPGVADIVILRGAKATPDAPLDLVIEIPHGATQTEDFTSMAAQLTSPLPDSLVDFFHVNTDAGAPELGSATARHIVAAAPERSVAIICSRIPRTFIDCNRRLDASAEDFKAGKVTPGLMPWITSEQDRALLRAAYDHYVTLVRETAAELASDGAMLLLHSYAPRTVDVEVDLGIVQNLRNAYEPDTEQTWPLRPEIDVIGKTLDGKNHVPATVVEALRKGMAALDLTVADGITYPLHPSTLAYDHVMARPGRTLCLEVRRDLLADPFEPFVQMRIPPAKVERLAVPLAAALLRWW
ncbi:MAG: N-formylglutamate amidohydrolase [Deltaproteobacteria bacterium]|nr:N-formylglutamate amidohydrolase [Deltaproteobacteria bacterium]